MARQAFARGDITSALKIAQRLILEDSDNADAHLLLGSIAHFRGLYDDAISSFSCAASLRPQEATILLLIARSLFSRGDLEKALSHLQEAQKIQPLFPDASVLRASIHERQGEYDQAQADIADLVNMGLQLPQLNLIRSTLALRQQQFQKVLEIAGPSLHDPGTSPAIRRQLAFIIGQAYDKLDDVNRAMQVIQLAHRQTPTSFQPDEFKHNIDKMIELFSVSGENALAHSTNTSELPIFIAGMPRSGTTLVEQIIDAHPIAFGAGELKDIDRMRDDLPRTIGAGIPYPDCLPNLTSNHFDKLAENYLGRLLSLGDDKIQRVINKNLENFRHLGFIALLFPHTRIIHCTRNPLDTCLSIYMNPFHQGMYPFASDLHHLGMVYRQVDRLMNHWRSVLDIPILEVNYETLITNSDQEIRKIIKFCGLPWDNSCLDFHQTGRTVMTLSHHQVSRPVYSSSIGRSQKYAAHLAPLRAALAENDFNKIDHNP